MSVKFGLIYFRNFKYEDIAWGLLLNGMDAEIIDTEISRESTSIEDVDALTKMLCANSIGVAITNDFCPALSDACMKLGIPYVSWMFDSPIQMLYEEQVKNNCNIIFSFDKRQIENLKQRTGVSAYYLPIGTNLTRNSQLEITKGDEKKYSCEVSFIGSLYSEHNFISACERVSADARFEIENILESAFGRWDGSSRLYGELSKDTISELKNIFGNDTKMDDDTLFSTAILGNALAYRERVMMLESLSRYDLKFYTNDKEIFVNGVTALPGLDYLSEVPKAYRFSKINMNLTMPGITSGVPLRVFDIMGMGGFMLTNFQPEVEELFTIGENIESYKSFDEMNDKVAFYLENEDKRMKIAKSGYELVRKNYSCEMQVKKIIEVMNIAT